MRLKPFALEGGEAEEEGGFEFDDWGPPNRTPIRSGTSEAARPGLLKVPACTIMALK